MDSLGCKVSVVVPNFNHQTYLLQRLDSICNQTFADFEVILLDDCSTDQSIEVLKRFATHPKVKGLFVNDENTGSAFLQWGKGLSFAQGEYIWIAESDDFADETFLEKMLPFLENNPEVGIAFCNSQTISADGSTLGVTSTIPESELTGEATMFPGSYFAAHYMIYACSIPNVSACLFRREALNKINFSAIQLRLTGDWFVYHVVMSEYQVVYLNRILNYFRHHEQNVRSSMYNSPRSTIEHLELFSLLQHKNVLPSLIVRKAVNTHLVVYMDYLFKSHGKGVSLSLLFHYVRIFKKNIFKLLYGYFFRYKRR